MKTSTGKTGSSASTGISVIGRTSPIEPDVFHATVNAGLTVGQIVGEASDDVKVLLEGQYISREQWGRVKPKAGTTLEVVRAPRGDSIKGVILAIIIVVIAIWAPYALGMVTAAGGLTAGGMMLTASIMIIGGALLSPQPPRIGSGANGSSSASGRYNAITSTSNQLNQYGNVNKLFGKNWVAPPLAALPYSEVQSDKQFVYTLLAVGYGNLKVLGIEMPYGSQKVSVAKIAGYISNPAPDLSKIKIGDTILSEFDDFILEIGYKDDISMFADDILEDRVDVSFSRATQPLSVIRTTAAQADSASIDITFARGLYSMNSHGSVAPGVETSSTRNFCYYIEGTETIVCDAVVTITPGDDVVFTIEYALTGSELWHPFNGTDGKAIIKGGAKKPFAKSFDMNFPESGAYDIKVTRVSSYQRYADYVFNDAAWTTLRSIKLGQSFGIENVLLVAMKIKATDQISGSLDNISIYTETLLPEFDINGMTGAYSVSNNPAMAYLEAMTGVQNVHKIPEERIDFEELVYWRDWCDENSIKYDYIHSDDETLLQRLMSIPAAAFANHNIVDGKFSVVTDKDQPVSHVINPRNTRSFTAKKMFVDLPHGFRVEFVNRNTGKPDEIIAYADGYNDSNSSKFELLQTSGIKDALQAWKYGRYHLAQATLRPEIYTVSMDIEQLRVTRGDTVKLSYDVMLVGLAWGRIVSVDPTELVVDELLGFLNGTAYSILIRKQDGTTIEFPVSAAQGETRTVQWSLVAGVTAGDVFAFGESGKVTIEAKVTSVSASDKDMGAIVTMTDAARNIYDAWTGDIPIFNSAITVPFELRAPLPPVITAVTSGINNLSRGIDGSYITAIDVMWSIPSSPIPVSGVEIKYTRAGGESKKVVVPLNDSGSYQISDGVFIGDYYDIQIASISATGTGVRSNGNIVTNIKAFEVSDFVDTQAVPEIISLESGTAQLVLNGDGTLTSRVLITYRRPQTVPDVVRYEIGYKHGGQDNFTMISLDGDSTSAYLSGTYDGAIYEVRIRAVYQSDIVSDWNTSSIIALGKQEAPSDVSGFTSSIEGADILLKWSESSDLDNKEYEIRYGGQDWGSAEFILRVKTTSWLQKAVAAGSHSWRIKAVDTSGLLSGQNAVTSIVIQAPKRPVVRSEVIDNNVLLYWDSESGTLPIESYHIYKNNVYIGAKKGEFTTIFETKSGEYTYKIVSVDVAGNESEGGYVTSFVSQPPDYVLNVDWYDDFSGNMVNAIIEDGQLLLPVSTAETFQDHFDSSGFLSPQDQIDAGFEYYTQPSPLTASYERVFDYGTALASTLITMSITKAMDDGNLSLSTTISTSIDGVTYIDYQDQNQVYALNFRYVKIALNYSGVGGDDTVILDMINVRLDSKIKSDAGMGSVTNADAGAIVTFNQQFIDISSINLSAASGGGAVSAIYDFVDTPNPLEFIVYLLDESGIKVTGDFSWTITGH